MRLYLIRHAESENNALAEESVQRRKVDPDLTPLGYQQRDLLARHIAGANGGGYAITHLYTSAMARSLLTAKPLAEALGLAPAVWLDLHELGGMYQMRDGADVGFGGMTRAEISRKFEGYQLPEALTERGWYDASQGYEAIERSVERANAVAAKLHEWRECERVIALVSHAGFLNLLLQAINGDEHYRKGWRYYHNNTAITRIDYAGAGPILHYMNRVDHLPAGMRSH